MWINTQSCKTTETVVDVLPETVVVVCLLVSLFLFFSKVKEKWPLLSAAEFYSSERLGWEMVPHRFNVTLKLHTFC